MTLHITPEMVEACYDFLRTTPPYKGWKLPPGEMIKFVISLSPKHFAQYWWNGSQHVIEISANSIAHIDTLVEKLCHEMIHLELEIKGLESKTGGANVHNAAFRKRAALVCKYHGYDPKAFY